MNTTNLSEAIRNQDTISKVRHLKVSDSSLGGSTSTFIHLSLDDKETWTNNIFHNSRYAIFGVQDGKVELISKGLGMPKFRKCNAKNEANVAEKIVKYCYSV